MRRPDETHDDLRLGALKLLQPVKGYRFSLDPLLLTAFARVKKGEAVADLGSGSGVIPLLLARRSAARRIVGVELQPEAADRAQRSVLLNGLQERVQILPGDVRRVGDLLPPQSFQVVLANPPYREPHTGRQAPDAERAMARHLLAGGLEAFLQAAFFLLVDGGRFYQVFLAERLPELLAAMRQARLEPKRLRCVHARPGAGAQLVLVEGRKRGRPGLKIEPPLFVREGEGEGYSAEVRRIYGGDFTDPL